MIIIAIIVIVVIAAAIGIWAISTTNNFKALDIKTQEGLSGIEVALEKRYDMLTKLFDASKGYMKHERDLFTSTVALRKGMGADELNDASKKMDAIQSRLFAVAEGYPQLASSQVFTELQQGIRDAEDHLQAARRIYNVDVTSYNTAIAMFPASLLAGGRAAKEFFRTDDQKRGDVEMRFE